MTGYAGKDAMVNAPPGRAGKFRAYMKNHASLYIMVLPGIALILIFNYLPMYGVVMAFQNFKPALGLRNSAWAGLKHFNRIVGDRLFMNAFRNTALLGLYSLIFGFPAPILLALLFNEMRNQKYKRVAQTISYMPYFLSTVIVVGIMKDMLSMNDGVVNDFIYRITGNKINFFVRAEWFRTLYIGSNLWQGIGYSSIIYLAAISGVSPELYESAVIDGAGRFKQIAYITLPSILPTIVILFIFAVGGVLGNDYQKILLIYSAATYSTSDVINTYVFRAGIEGANQSYAAAVGLFSSVISLVLLVITNYLAKKTGETSLW